MPDQSISPKHSNNPFQSDVHIILPSASVVSETLAAPPNELTQALISPSPPVESLDELFLTGFLPKSHQDGENRLIATAALPLEQQVDLARLRSLLQQRIEAPESDVYIRQGPLIDTAATRGERVTWLACEGRESCYLPSIQILSRILEHEEWSLPPISTERFSRGTVRVLCYLATDPTTTSSLGIAVTLEGFIECVNHFEASVHTHGEAREPSIIRDLIDYRLCQRALDAREGVVRDNDAVSPDEYREQITELFKERSYITFFMPSDRETIAGGYYTCGISYQLANSKSGEGPGLTIFRQRLTVSRDNLGVLQVRLQPWV